jgi:NADH-quinone oxidoreductase subunit D
MSLSHITDRLDYISPLSNNVAVALAIENALGIEAPPRAQWIRTLVCEYSAIFFAFNGNGLDLYGCRGADIILWTFTEREKLYDIFELICGARFTTSYSRIGGIANDINDDILARIKAWAEQFPSELKYFEKLVHRNRIFIDRIAGVGILPPDKAIKLGTTGPVCAEAVLHAIYDAIIHI